MKFFTQLLILAALWPGLAVPVLADKPLQVLASVHPLGLVAASVVPPARLRVLLPPGVTPHDFSLRPSDITVIQTADVILWAGADAEPYLAGFVHRWPDKIWIDVSRFAPPLNPADRHADHDHHHHHDGQDPHWWFSPPMMVKAQQQLAQVLGVDAGDFARSTGRSVALATQRLAPLRTRGFFVFHRAYDHWVDLLELNQAGAFTLTPEQKPGLKTLQSMRRQLQRGEVVCVFSEPQFSPALVESVVKGLPVKRGELDPMAQHIPLQANGYALFLTDLTDRFVTCLQP